MLDSQERIKTLLGPLYDSLSERRETTLAYLLHPDPHVRIAAIIVFESHWKGGDDQEFLSACRRIAINDTADSVRAFAINTLGKALKLTCGEVDSQILADIVINDTNDDRVRLMAYWALREIQLGVRVEDLIHKSLYILKSAPLKEGSEAQRVIRELDENEFLRTIGSDWISKIDWDFVRQFATRRKETTPGNEPGT